MDGLNAAIQEILSTTVTASRPLHGGSLSEVRLVTLANNSTCVAKTGPLVAREGEMLAAMRDAGAPVPRVFGTRGDVLLLEAFEETAPSQAAWRALAQGLKTLHSNHGASYGWPVDYAFGSLSIPNQQMKNWAAFWTENRLLSTIQSLPPDLAARLEALAARLPELLPANPPASLLHGDLWGGNVLFSGSQAYLIDPASYYGDAEVDLAMLHLFGGPDPEFSHAYGPLLPGWQQRRAVYQLWPALVHLNLFGSGYRNMVTGLLNKLGA